MRRLKLIKESESLNRMEFYLKVINHFKDKYDLTVSIDQSGEDFYVFIANYAIDVVEPEDDAIAKDLKSFWNRNAPEHCKAEEVLVTGFGYQVVLKYEDEEEKEDTHDDDILMTEAVSREDIQSHTANQVLDNKYVWFFTVMDAQDNILDQNIEDVSDAIDIIIANDNAYRIIALPYVDPDPENPDVEMVLSENPGPIILYDKEELEMQGQVEEASNKRPTKRNIVDLLDADGVLLNDGDIVVSMVNNEVGKVIEFGLGGYYIEVAHQFLSVDMGYFGPIIEVDKKKGIYQLQDWRLAFEGEFENKGGKR